MDRYGRAPNMNEFILPRLGAARWTALIIAGVAAAAALSVATERYIADRAAAAPNPRSRS